MTSDSFNSIKVHLERARHSEVTRLQCFNSIKVQLELLILHVTGLVSEVSIP